MYIILICMAYNFIYPFIYMLATSIKSIPDFMDPTVLWIPNEIFWANFTNAIKGLSYWGALKNSAIIALCATMGKIISCSMVGYGFARMKFRFNEVLFALALLTFIVPPQTIIVPLYILFRRLEEILGFQWIDTHLPLIVPSFFGNGLRGAIFIFIFRQFFKQLPWELEDAAMIDGAGPLRMYAQIMLPLAKPAVIVTFLFSLVWHWTDFFEPSVYLSTQSMLPLPLKLNSLGYEMVHGGGAQSKDIFSEPLVMAACLLTVLPILIIYIFAQRQFVEGIERTGVVG